MMSTAGAQMEYSISVISMLNSSREEDEPEIFATTRQKGTVLENIVVNSEGVQTSLT